MSIPQVAFEQDPTKAPRSFIELTKKGRLSSELKLRHKNGDPVIVNLNAVKLPNGKLIAFCENITERKQKEASLIESEKKFSTIINSITDAIILIDQKAKIVYCNDAASTMFGYTKNELLGSPVFSIVPPDVMRKAKPSVDKFGKTKAIPASKETISSFGLKKNHERFPIKLSLTSINLQGQTHAVGIICDVTERKNAEESLLFEQSLIKTLFKDSPEFIYFKDKEAKYQKIGKRFCDFFKLSEKDIIGKTALDVFSGEDAKRIYEEDLQVIKTGNPLINNEEFAHGIWVLTTKMPWFDKDGNIIGLFGISRDITERKKAEEILKESEEKYRNLFETAPDGIATMNMKGTITSVNPSFLRLTGFSMDEIVGKNFNKIGTIRARDIPKYVKIISSILRGKTPKPTEFVYVRKDGTKRWGESHIRLMKQDGRKTGLLAVLRDITERKETFEKIEDLARFPSENPNPVLRVNKDGTLLFSNNVAQILISEQKTDEKLQFLELLQWSVLDALRSGLSKKVEIKIEAKIFSFVFAPVVESGYVNVYGRDITGRKEAEKDLFEAFNELALANEKLGVVGRLTRHDVRNKLSAVLGNIYLAKQALPADSEIVKYLNETESAVDQIQRIFDFARTYEQLGVAKLSYVDVGESFERAVSLITSLSGIEIVNDCSGVNVMSDSLLDTLFYNLIDNSIKHGERVSKIGIYCKTGKDELKLVYEDDGIGISEAEKELIFNEGYGKNTGLGQYMIKKMCEVYGWNIQETGKQGKGAQFTITVPKGKYQPLN